MPTNDDLRRRALMLLGNARYDRVGQKSSAAQRAPRLGLDSALGVRLTQPSLLKSRVHLDLIEHWRDTGLADDPIEMLDLEVGNADGPRKAHFSGPDQRAPRSGVEIAAGRGPVNEIKIDITDVQSRQAGIDGQKRLVVALVVVPHLCREKDLVSRHARG